MTVSNMTSSRGNPVANQFIISDVSIIVEGRHDTGMMFQSYYSNIAFISYSGQVYLDRDLWDYSGTTGKYRNIFLGETKKQTEAKIASGLYTLTDLNEY